jgi:hypothetical protein
MRLYLDLDSRAFIESPQFPRILQSLALKRRDRIPLDVQFLRGGIVTELAQEAAGRLGIKADKDFNGPFAASDLSWVKTGSAESASYRFDLNLNTLQINALFAGVPTPSAVALMLEIEWTEGDLRTSSGTLSVSLENDVVRGDEGLPEEAVDSYPLPSDILTGSGNLAGIADTAQARVNLGAAPSAAPGFRLDPLIGLQLINETTGKWHTLFLTGADGATQLAWSETGEL